VLLVDSPILAAAYTRDFEAQWLRSAEGTSCGQGGMGR